MYAKKEGRYVEIESVSVDCSRDQKKIRNYIPVVSVSDRGKRMVNYNTSSRIDTVDDEIKGIEVKCSEKQ